MPISGLFHTGLCILLAANPNEISLSIPSPDRFGWHYRHASRTELLQLRAYHLGSQIINATARNHTRRR